MSTNATGNQNGSGLAPGDQLFSEHGGIYWITSIEEGERVVMEDVEGDEKEFEHDAIEAGLEEGSWTVESRAPGTEGHSVEKENRGRKVMASELIARLQQAVEEQGDCEPFFVMEKEGDGYNPLTTFDFEIVAEDGIINIVCKNGSDIPKVPHEEIED